MCMSMTKWRPAAHLSLLAALGFVTASDGFAVPKDEVAVFRYAGVVDGDVSSRQFSVFQGILKDKLSLLSREVSQSDDVTHAHLRSMHVRVIEKDSFQTSKGVNDWLDNQTSVLCVLRGTIVSDDSVTYVVKSDIHLGRLRGSLPYELVKISLPINSREFGNNRDSHSVVILYALAMDASRLGYDRSYTAGLLNAASSRLADIKRRGGDVSADLVDLDRAIQTESNKLRGRQ